MGMIACYTEADRELIDELKTKSDEDILEEIENLQEEAAAVYDMDKLWDGLHFLLTGVSATTPLQNNLLSEAVIGTELFSEDEESDFISYIYPERVHMILSALEKVKLDALLKKFSPKVFAKKRIYPDIWDESDKDFLKEELSDAFTELKRFFKATAERKKGIIVSIY